MDTEADYEKERQEIWKALTDACRPLAEPKMRMALGLAILGQLIDEPRIEAEPILECIARGEAELYLRRFPPTGCAS
jgi:hypothetical protein